MPFVKPCKWDQLDADWEPLKLLSVWRFFSRPLLSKKCPTYSTEGKRIVTPERRCERSNLASTKSLKDPKRLGFPTAWSWYSTALHLQGVRSNFVRKFHREANWHTQMFHVSLQSRWEIMTWKLHCHRFVVLFFLLLSTGKGKF